MESQKRAGFGCVGRRRLALSKVHFNGHENMKTGANLDASSERLVRLQFFSEEHVTHA